MTGAIAADHHGAGPGVAGDRAEPEIVVEFGSAGVRVRIGGALAAPTAGRVHDAVLAALDQHPARVDLLLRDAVIVDVVGLAAVVSAVRLGRRHGIDVQVVEPSAAVERLLSATGLARVLTIRRVAASQQGVPKRAGARGAGATPQLPRAS